MTGSDSLTSCLIVAGRSISALQHRVPQLPGGPRLQADLHTGRHLQERHRRRQTRQQEVARPHPHRAQGTQDGNLFSAPLRIAEPPVSFDDDLYGFLADRGRVLWSGAELQIQLHMLAKVAQSGINIAFRMFVEQFRPGI